MNSYRPATPYDIDELCTLDPIAQRDGERREFIKRSVSEGVCHVAVGEGKLVGYAVLTYSFFETGYVAMLMVHPEARRQGVGYGLMRYCELRCRTPKLFTSTNLSNLPMQALLARLGYELSGVIHHLDEGDPELVFVKYLRDVNPWEVKKGDQG